MAETRVGIVTNPDKAGAAQLLPRLMEGFARRGVATALDEGGAALIGKRGQGRAIEDLAGEADLLVVLGGDGTILHVVGRLRGGLKPLAAINTGTLGFLTCATGEDVDRFVEVVAGGQYVLSPRSVLEVSVGEDGGQTRYGLNEAAVNRRDTAGMITLEARINGAYCSSYSGDGLIIATPTGSTAYSFSAGGAIVEPESEVLLLTPICPHALTNRSMVVPDSSRIEVTLASEREDGVLTVDGQFVGRVGPRTLIRVARAPFELPLIQMPGQTFYDILMQKLRWHGSNV